MQFSDLFNVLPKSFSLVMTSVGFFHSWRSLPHKVVYSQLSYSLIKMRQKERVTEETFIRQLPYGVQKHFSGLLDIDEHWERFVGRIPRKLPDLGKEDCEKRYSPLQIRLFEKKQSPTRSILGNIHYEGFNIRKSVIGVCKQHRHRPACAFVRSDQCLLIRSG